MTSGRLVVVGASGLLGSALCRRLEALGRDYRAPSRNDLDLADPNGIAPALESLAPAAVLNATAFTDVARAELAECRDDVFLLNRDAPAALARACRGMGIPFVHVSTDYVFDGTARRPYREEDPTRPLQVYGRSKLEGEDRVCAGHPDAVIVRTSTLYGPTTRPRQTYVDAILSQARSSDSVRVVVPPVSSPTYAPDLAEFLLRLLDAGRRGLYHCVNDGACNRMELARAVIEEAGLGGRVRLVSRAEPPGTLRRPAYSVLDVSKLESAVGLRPRPWREALREYLREHRGAGR